MSLDAPLMTAPAPAPAATIVMPDDAAGAPARHGIWRRLVAQPMTLICLILLGAFALVAIFAPWLAPYDPTSTNTPIRLRGPSAAHWLGTDSLGRDVLSRVIYGSRLALGTSIASVSLAVVVGTAIGLFIGYRGGMWDRVAMRIVDAMQSIPALVFAFAIIAVIGRGLVPATLAVSLIFSIMYIRITRGIVLREREQLYVDAARVAGLSTPRIVFREILPNLAGPLIVESSIHLGSAQLIIAMLSFLGLGVDVDAPDWGGMLSDARIYQAIQPFISVPSGVAITLSVLLFNMLGDGLRDIVTGTGSHTRARIRPPHRPAPATVVNDAIVLQASGLCVDFPGGDKSTFRILDNVGLTLRRGETFGLVGESGSGKSMTALAMLGLVPSPGGVTAGSVMFGGRDLLAASEAELARIRGNAIGMIFQDPIAAFSPVHAIGRQIAEPLRAHRGLSARAAQDRAAELLDRVGVPNARRRLDDYPHQFSGGMAQRAMIAMAIACEPRLLIADEPTTALDVTIQAQVLDLLEDLKSEFGMAILLITHDLGMVAETCDRMAVMYAGQVVETGDVATVFTSPRHPYSEALMSARPRNRPADGRLPTIEGRVPLPWAWPDGCRFHPRCRHAVSACQSGPNPLVADVRCIRRGELALRGIA